MLSGSTLLLHANTAIIVGNEKFPPITAIEVVRIPIPTFPPVTYFMPANLLAVTWDK